MKRRETFGPGDLNVQAGFTSNMISGGASEDYDTLKEIEEKVKSNTEDIEQNKTDISLLKENVEFTPRFIGQYSIPWLGQYGTLTAKLVQLNKKNFILSINGGGTTYTTDKEIYDIELIIPVKIYEFNEVTLEYSSAMRLGDSSTEQMCTGIAIFKNNNLRLKTPVGKSISSLSDINIIIYGELIEDETTG